MPRLLLVILLMTPMLLIPFLAVWQRNAIIQLGYETEALQNERAALLRRQKDLLANISRLSSIERIEQLALEEIQMKQPTPEQRIYVSKEKTDS